MAEGTVFFADEPILRVTAPLPEAQLVESRLINILHFQTLIASKAARMVLAAPGKLLVDFGLRRAHGAEAGADGGARQLHRRLRRHRDRAGRASSSASRSSAPWPIPSSRRTTTRRRRSRDFARARPRKPDPADRHLRHRGRGAEGRGAGAAAQGRRHHHPRRAPRQRRSDRAVARACGASSTTAALRDVTIFASGGLDEDAIARLLAAGAPIDGFGVGTSLTTSSDVPALDCAYKLQEYAGTAAAQAFAGQGDLARAASRSGGAMAPTAAWPATCSRSRATSSPASR